MREIKLANSLGATKNLRHFKILLSTDKLIKLNELIFAKILFLISSNFYEVSFTNIVIYLILIT
jgi:hypothetical protein